MRLYGVLSSISFGLGKNAAYGWDGLSLPISLDCASFAR